MTRTGTSSLWSGHRRQLLKTCISLGLTRWATPRRATAAGVAEVPPVRTITRGPQHHWFGYYDKLQFDPTNRFVLSNQVSFEHRTPRADDVIQVGMVDTHDADRWIALGESRAWGWQQGCMLQWLPRRAHEILWNDREGDRFVSRILDVKTRALRTLPQPIYAVSPDARFGLTADFARIQVMRPGYGYVGLPDPFGDELAPGDSGVWSVDLGTGENRLVLSLSDVARIPHAGETLADRWHYFNHLLISPDGGRFIVLHRWRARDSQTGRPTGNFTTRMITANVDGGDVYLLDPSGHTSHFIWRDPEHICAWTQPAGKQAAFYLLRDRTRQVDVVAAGVMTENGHNTYLPLPDRQWILCDTYPDGNRNQRPYLYHTASGRRVWLGDFHSPAAYQGEWRCDTHPRSSNDGRTICIDSPHGGGGRQLHLIDVSGIVG
jgi:hypothetical protein